MSESKQAGAHDPTPALALADLARAGYLSMRQPFMQVDFEVHHLKDRPGYLDDLLRAPTLRGDGGSQSRGKHRDVGTFMETLSTSSFGVGLVVGTRTGKALGEFESKPHDGSSPVKVVSQSTPDGLVFLGTAKPNLTFLYEASRVFEGIIVLDDQPKRVFVRDGLLIRKVVAFIAQLAAETAHAPILSLQSPVQIPSASWEGEPGRLPRSSSLAVRFAIALQQPSTQLRLRLGHLVERYCEENGLGLWLSDTRPGYRSGNWFLIKGLDRAKAAKHADPTFDRVGGHGLELCMPMTLVGPARVGSTDAVLKYLSRFSSASVLGCSISSLDDLAFIHLQLAVLGEPASARERLSQRVADATSGEDNTLGALERTLDVVLQGDRPYADNEGDALLLNRVGDYQVLVGPAVDLDVAGGKVRKLGIWVSWRWQSANADLFAPLTTLNDAVRALGLSNGEAPNIEYLVCRHVGDSVLRAKGKLALMSDQVDALFPNTAYELGVSRLCVSLEDAWRAAIEDADVPGVSDVTVSWREYWLGHWTAPA